MPQIPLQVIRTRTLSWTFRNSIQLRLLHRRFLARETIGNKEKNGEERIFL
jgi:hypothetical protein